MIPRTIAGTATAAAWRSIGSAWVMAWLADSKTGPICSPRATPRPITTTAMAAQARSMRNSIMPQVSASPSDFGSDDSPNHAPIQKTRPRILSKHRVLSAVRVISPTRDQTQRRMIRCNMVPKSRQRYPATWSLLPTASDSSSTARPTGWVVRVPGSFGCARQSERNVLCESTGPTPCHGWVGFHASRLPRAGQWGRYSLDYKRLAV